MTDGWRRRLSAGFVAVCLVAVPAAPVSAQDRAEQIGNTALATIDYPWQQLGWTIEFLPGRTGYLGLAIGAQRRIEIYVRDHHTVADVTHTLAHEMGHAVDLTYGTRYRRRQYQQLRGLAVGAGWFGCDACDDYATPAGDFAEVFEYWLLGGGDFRSRLGGPPSAERLDALSTLFVEPFPPSVRVFWRQRWQPSG